MSRTRISFPAILRTLSNNGAGVRSSVPAQEKADQDRPDEAPSPASKWKGRINQVNSHLRGWIINRKHPGRQYAIAISIDGEQICSIRADRPRPNLGNTLGVDNIRHGFDVLIPSRFHDDREHVARIASAEGENTGIECSFSVQRGAPIPEIDLMELSPKFLLCLHAPGKIAGDPDPVGIWIENSRVAGTVETLALGDGEWQIEFSPTGPKVQELLRRDARIGVAGAHEIGESAKLRDKLGLSVLRLRANRILVTSNVLVPQSLDLDLMAQVYADPELEKLIAAVELDLTLGSDEIEFQLSETDDIWVVIGSRGEPWLSTVRLAPRLGELADNPSFRHWTNDRPVHWLVGGGVRQAQRSYFAFPRNVARQHRVSGDAIALELVPGTQTEILRQSIVNAPGIGGSNICFAVAARATEPIELYLALSDSKGPLAAQFAEIGPDWGFVRRSAEVGRQSVLGSDLTLAVFAIAGSSAEPIWCEIAGIGCGEDATFAARGNVADAKNAPHPNLVVNASLCEWPHGLNFRRSIGRFESARGWFVYNRHCTKPPVVSLKAPATGSGSGSRQEARYGIEVAADSVPQYCRVEIRLHHLRAAHHILKFTAYSRYDDLQTDGAGRSANVKIDRVFLMRRTAASVNGRSDVRDSRIANIAKRVLLSAHTHTFEFSVKLDENMLAEQVNSEDYLVFEFVEPFGIVLEGVELVQGEIVPVDDIRGEFGGFEDPAVAAQLGGIGGDRSVRAALTDATAIPANSANASAETCRWSWRAHQSGSVDVVICVHNAIDETLSCLASLCVSSSVPHTACIVDDCSSTMAHNRLREFIRDKPWMRIMRNEENIGYTRSANRGIYASDADWVILLNSDTVATAEWISGLLECATSRPDIACVGPLSNAATYQSIPEIYDQSGKWRVNELPAGASPNAFAEFVRTNSIKAFPAVPLLNGFCTLIRRSVFADLGGFNEAAFPHGYGEENDFCVRVTKAGYRLCIADHVYVYHRKSASFGSDRRAELSKAGNAALRALHPDIDFQALGRQFADTASLAHIRERARTFYDKAR